MGGYQDSDDDDEAWLGGETYPGRSDEGPEARLMREAIEQEHALQQLLRSLVPSHSKQRLAPFRPGPGTKESRW